MDTTYYSITFLGIQLDTVSQVTSIPREKLAAIQQDLAAFRSKTKCTKGSLLSVIGKLAFAAKAIPAGRIFIRRLQQKSFIPAPSHTPILVNAGRPRLVDSFLAYTWNGKSFFLDHEWTPSPAFQLFIDASHHGYGCFWQGHWLNGSWSHTQLKHDIQWKELFAITIAAQTWGAQWNRKRLLVHCDNHAVVDSWRAGTCKQPALVHLIRSLFFTAATHNFTLTLQHIRGTALLTPCLASSSTGSDA